MYSCVASDEEYTCPLEPIPVFVECGTLASDVEIIQPVVTPGCSHGVSERCSVHVLEETVSRFPAESRSGFVLVPDGVVGSDAKHIKSRSAPAGDSKGAVGGRGCPCRLCLDVRGPRVMGRE